MKRPFLFFILICLAFSSCRKPVPDASPPPLEDNTGAVAPSPTSNLESMEMKGINLYMHRRVTAEGASGKPELWVRADSFSIEEGQVYTFEGAHAVIYTRDDGEITVDANRGRFEQDKSAVLEGEVRLVAGTLKMILNDIQWQRGEEDTGGMALTDNPVIIDDPDLQLNAADMRLHPDTRVFELGNVSGVVRFGKELM